MLDAVKNYINLASGVTEVTRQRAISAAKALQASGEATAEQVQNVADELLVNSRNNRDAMLALVRYEVDRALNRLGLATADEMASLQRRVTSLEGALAQSSESAGRAGASASTPPSSTARKTAAATSPAKATAAKSTAAKAAPAKAAPAKASPAKSTAAKATPAKATKTAAAKSPAKATAAKSTAAKSTAAKSTAAKSTAAKSTATKAAAPAKKAAGNGPSAS